jgi:hypothetical protein
MKALKIRAPVLTYIEPIYYSEKEFGTARICEKLSASNLITIVLSLYDRIKLIFSEAFFYKIFLLPNLFLLASQFKVGGRQNAHYGLYTNIIYRFTSYTNWLAYKNQGNFVIGIVGRIPPCYEREDSTSNKTVGIGKVVVKKMPSLSDTYNCSFLFTR